MITSLDGSDHDYISVSIRVTMIITVTGVIIVSL